jgi:Ca-activated chloride channel family protein
VDGDRLEGQLLARDEARRIYEDIVRRRRDPALLEYVGRNAFQASVYPIPPGGERRIELEYSQVLPVDNGLVEYVYPLNTEKFSARPLEDVVVNVSVRSNDPIKAVYSPSHDVDVVRRGDYNADVGYEAYDVLPDQDFVLYYTVSPQDVGLNLLTYKPDPEGEGFFLLLAAPRVEIDTRQVVAKDVILVLDISGSMRGAKIEQAKEALDFVLDNLHEEDRFNVIAFSTGTRPYARGLVSAGERGEARAFVERLEASGSTDINRALLEAVAMAGDARPTTLIFLTDGLPTVGEVEIERIIDNLADAAPDSVRIFPFGVGYDVNTTLLDTVAQNHRGASGYVLPEEAIDEKVSAFYAKVSTPLLADLALDFGRADVADAYPYPLPDLFAGSQLIVVGRYDGSGEATVTLRGEVNDEPQVFEYGGVHFRDAGGEAFIARLWATRKIGYLLKQIRLNGEADELVDEIVDLSVRYGIVTPYTSFLVEETDRALRAGGREELSNAASTATPAPAFGQEAVQRSTGEKELAEADAPMMPPAAMPAGEGGAAASPVRYVGAKTFVLHEGAWTDTTYDPDRMETVPVGFGSEDYFALVAARPEWGRYFALGEHVIVVLDGTAYEVREGEAQPVDVPASAAAPGAQDPSATEPAASVWEAAWQFLADLVEQIADLFRGEVDLAYPVGADDLVIEAGTRGGLVPPQIEANHIPGFRLYGDGRAVWIEEKDRGISVWEGRLDTGEIDALLRWMQGQGFFGMDELYTGENPPMDLPTSCIRVHLVEQSRSVCEYYQGAPEAFDEIYRRLQAGAGASDVHAYQPEIAWAVAERLEWDAGGEVIAWPELLSPALSALEGGAWVEGETLAFLWRNRLEQGAWMIYEELGDRYTMVIQVPGLVPGAPSAP